MTWLNKYLQDKQFHSGLPLHERNLMLGMGIFLAFGLVTATALMVYKELFRSDIANPVAETAHILMFAASLSLVARNRMRQAVYVVFFIPGIIIFQYLSDFSNSASPSETLPFSTLWFSAGFVFLALFSSFGFHYVAFYAAALLTLIYHLSLAQAPFPGLSDTGSLITYPLFQITSVFIFAALVRIIFDRQIARLSRKISKRDNNGTMFFWRPKIRWRLSRQYATKTETSPDLFLTGLTMPLNRNSESPSCRQNQELNYMFNLAFRNEINWNNLIIFNPNSMTEFFSPVSEHWLNLHIVWINQSDCLAFFYDISREKNLIGELQRARNRYLTLLEAIPDIFFVIDRDGIYQDVVFKGQEKLYPETTEIIGNSIFNVGFQKNMARKIFECIRKSISADTIETIEYTLTTQGPPLFFEMRIARLDENSVVSIARDITRRKKAEFELGIAKTKAEEAAELKSRFLANLSHDIRTPMNAILGFTKILTEPGLSDFEKEDYVQEIHLQGNILMKMIENTIQLSKIETNTLDINFSFTPVNRLLREILNYFYPQLPENRDICLKMSTGIQAEEAGFETDPALLKEVLHRLIDNAVKFTLQGSIEFGYFGVGGNMAEFFVEDTGPGIADSERENIFLRFYVIESDRRANRSGPGLGLSIAQHFVAILGGELKLNSTPGKGSRFWFRLPLKNPGIYADHSINETAAAQKFTKE